MSDEFEDIEQVQDSQVLIPTEQNTLSFHDKPLIVVRLPDGRNGVVLRWLCENLNLVPAGQIGRIRRTESIADDLIYVRIQTDGGPQNMATLVLHAVPYWLATIDTRRMDKDDPRRIELLAYQREAVDALYAWASTPREIASPTDLVPAEPITEPARPAPDASLTDWREYHLRMAAVLDWQIDIETWRGSVENRLEGLEATISDLIPDILEKLGEPELITPAHQQQVRAMVKRLSDATGKPFGAIYSDLYAAFDVPRYQELHEQDWDKVLNWFTVQIEKAKGKR